MTDLSFTTGYKTGIEHVLLYLFIITVYVHVGLLHEIIFNLIILIIQHKESITAVLTNLRFTTGYNAGI